MGSAPVGVVLVDGDRLAVVADSNRFAGRGAQWLSVVSGQLETIQVAGLASAAGTSAAGASAATLRQPGPGKQGPPGW